MASLVADYDSDEDSDQQIDQEPEKSTVQPEEDGKNFLISNDSDDSDTEQGQANVAATEKLPNPMQMKLPKPKIGKIKKKDKDVHVTAASVFTNPFEKAEIAKKSLLEKHVKMTESLNLTGKKMKICRKFKQGRCRFEKNCKFSHDLDANLSLRYMQDESTETKQEGGNEGNKQSHYPKLPPPPKTMGFMGTPHSLQASSKGPRFSHHQMRKFREQEQHMFAEATEDVDDDRGIADDKRKRRIGMSQTLVPPKKAMSDLAKQRVEERPWTVQRKY